MARNWNSTDLPAVNCLDLRKGSADRVTCAHCGRIVALATNKAGRLYTCEIINHTTDAGRMSERYVPWAPHFKECKGAAPAPAATDTTDRNVYGANELNGLNDPAAYHREITANIEEHVALSDPRLDKIIRFRLLSDPGFPMWEVSYCHGRLKDGTIVRVQLPRHQFPKRKLTGAIIDMCREERVYAKGIGILDCISTLN